MRICVVTPVCNQGPFLLEWIAWYKGLGFTDIIAVSNNCTDGSEILLNLLSDAGLVTHIALGHLATGTPPLRQAFDAAKAHPSIADMDWILVCDVDEFLVLHAGNGTISNFMRKTNPNFLGMAFHWKCFGVSGQKTYVDGLVHQQFLGAATEKCIANRSFKSIFRNPSDFATFNSHSPNGYLRTWGDGDAHWVNSRYQRMPNFISDIGRSRRSTAWQSVTHERAQMNHYIIRSAEHWAAKRGMPSASMGADRYTDEFFETHNRCDETDPSADRHSEQAIAFHTLLRDDPDLNLAHHAACAHYVKWLCERTGREFQNDTRFQMHSDLAKKA